MRKGYYIGKLLGVNFSIDSSWLLIFLLVIWNLTVAPTPGWSPAVTWTMSIIAATLFFLSVLVRELAHATVARFYGVPARYITLYLFGGVSDIEREPSSPREELLMGVTGTATNFLIAGISFVLGVWSTGEVVQVPGAPVGVMTPSDPLPSLLLGWLVPINIILSIANLLPGLPLGGGRILRSFLWKKGGDLRAATRQASLAGQVMAAVFAAAGVALLFGIRIPTLGEGWGGVWLLLISWIVYKEATDTYKHVLVRDTLSGVPVARLMRTDLLLAAPDTTVSALTREMEAPAQVRAFVTVDGARLLGVVGPADIRLIGKRFWETVTLEQIMTPVTRLATVTPQDEASDALHKLGQADVLQLPVLDDGRVVGVVRRGDILRWLQAHPDGTAGSAVQPVWSVSGDRRLSQGA